MISTKTKKYRKQWRLANLEKLAANQRRWRERHPDGQRDADRNTG